MGRLSFYSCSSTLGLAIFILCFMPNYAAPVQESGAKPYANEKGCYFMNKHYTSGHEIETNDPCMNCTCTGAAMMCYLRVCPFIKPLDENCKMQEHRDDCCPKYWCPKVYPRVSTPRPESEEKGCYVDGSYYDEGARLPIDPFNPCHACYCIRNVSVCTKETCELHIPGCYPRYKIGSCCPERYTCTEEAATTIPPTSTEEEVPPGCDVDGIFYNDGEVVPSNETCKKCYCMRHQVMCTAIECTAPGTNCVPHDVIEGQCCPERYDCPEGTEIPEFATTHMITTEEEYLNISTTMSPATLTTPSISVPAADGQLTSAVASESASTLESETAYPTTKGVRRIEDEELTTVAALDAEASTAESTSVPTDMSARPRVPKITEVPDEMFTTASAGRQRPTFRPIPGEGICRFEGKTYQTGEKVVPDDPCLVNCTCIHSVVKCDRIECVLNPPESRKTCKIKKIPDECCPKYVCDVPSLPTSNKTETPEQQIIVDVFSSTVGIEQETISASLGDTEDSTQRVTVTHIPVQQTEMDAIATTLASKMPEQEVTSESAESSSEVIIGQTIRETITVHTEEPEKELSTALTFEEEKQAKETISDKDLTTAREKLPRDKFSTTKMSEVTTESSPAITHEKAETVQTTDKTTIKVTSETEIITTPSTTEDKMIDVSKVTSAEAETTAVTLSSTEYKESTMLLTTKIEELAEITSTMVTESTSDVKLSTQKETIAISTTAKPEVEGTTIAQTEASEGTSSTQEAEEMASSTVAKDMLEQTASTSEETKQTIKEIKTTSSPLTSTKAEKVTIPTVTQKEEEFTSLELGGITSGPAASSKSTPTTEEVFTEHTKVMSTETIQSELDTKPSIEAEMITSSWTTKEEDKGVEVTRVDESTTDKIKPSIEDVTTRHSITEEKEFATAETTTDAESIISSTLKSATEYDITILPKPDEKITSESKKPTELDTSTISESETESVSEEAVTPKMSTSVSESEQQVTTMKHDLDITTLKSEPTELDTSTISESETESVSEEAVTPKMSTSVSESEQQVTTMKHDLDITTLKSEPTELDTSTISESETESVSEEAVTPKMSSSVSESEQLVTTMKHDLDITTLKSEPTELDTSTISESETESVSEEAITPKMSTSVSESEQQVTTMKHDLDITTLKSEPTELDTSTISESETESVSEEAVTPKMSTSVSESKQQVTTMKHDLDITTLKSEPTELDTSTISESETESVSEEAVTPKMSTSVSESEQQVTTMKHDLDITTLKSETESDAIKTETPKTTVFPVEKMVTTEKSEFDFTSVKVQETPSGELSSATDVKETSESEISAETTPELAAATVGRSTEEDKFTIQTTSGYVVTTPQSTEIVTKEDETITTKESEKVTALPASSTVGDIQPSEQDLGVSTSEPKTIFTEERESSIVENGTMSAIFTTLKSSLPEISTVTSTAVPKLSTEDIIEITEISKEEVTSDVHMTSSESVTFFSETTPKEVEESSDSGITKKISTKQEDKLTTSSLIEDFTSSIKEIPDEEQRIKTTLAEFEITSEIASSEGDTAVTEGKTSISTKEAIDEITVPTAVPATKVTDLSIDLTSFVEIKEKVATITLPEMATSEESTLLTTEVFKLKPSEDESLITTETTSSTFKSDAEKTTSVPKWSEPEFSTVQTEKSEELSTVLSSTERASITTEHQTISSEVGSTITVLPDLDEKQRVTTSEDLDFTTQEAEIVTDQTAIVKTHLPDSLIRDNATLITETSSQTPETSKFPTSEFPASEKFETTSVKPHLKESTEITEDLRTDFASSEIMEEGGMLTSTTSVSEAVEIVSIKSTDKIRTETPETDFTSKITMSEDTSDSPVTTSTKSSTVPTEEKTSAQIDLGSTIFEKHLTTSLQEVSSIVTLKSETTTVAKSEETTTTMKPERETISVMPEKTTESALDTEGVFSSKTSEATTLKISTQEEELLTTTLKPEREITIPFAERTRQDVSKEEPLSTMTTSGITIPDVPSLTEKEILPSTMIPDRTKEVVSTVDEIPSETTIVRESTIEEAEPLTSTFKPEKETVLPESTKETVTEGVLISKVTSELTTEKLTTVEEAKLMSSTLKPKITSEPIADTKVTAETSTISISTIEETASETSTVKSEETVSQLDVTFGTTLEEKEATVSTMKQKTAAETMVTSKTTFADSTLEEAELQTTTLKPEKTRETAPEIKLTSGEALETITLSMSSEEETESPTSTLKPEKSTGILTEGTSEISNATSKEISDITTLSIGTIVEDLSSSTSKPEKITSSILPERTTEVVTETDVVSTSESTVESAVPEKETEQFTSTLKSEITAESVTESVTSTSRLSTIEKEEHITTLESEGTQKTLADLDVISRHTTVTSASTSRITETQGTDSLTSTSIPGKETIEISTERTSMTTLVEDDDISKQTSETITSKFSTAEEPEVKLSTPVTDKETIISFTDRSKEVPTAGDSISKVTLETTTGKTTKIEEIGSVTTLEAQRTSEFVPDITSEIITSRFSTAEAEISTSTLKPEKEITGIFTEITQEPASKAVTSEETETLKVTGTQEESPATTLTPEKEITSEIEELSSKTTSEISESEISSEEAEPITSTLKSVKEILSTSTDISRETVKEIDFISKVTSETTTRTTTVADAESLASTMKTEISSTHVPEIDVSSEIPSKLSTIEEAEKLTSAFMADRETTSMLTESTPESISEIEITSGKETDTTPPKVSLTEETKLLTSTLTPERVTTGILTEETVELMSKQQAITSTPVFTMTSEIEPLKEKETPSVISETSTSETTSAKTTTITEEEAFTSTLKPGTEMTGLIEKATTVVDVTSKTFSETTMPRTTKKDLELITSTLKPEKESISTEVIEEAVSEEKEITSEAAETTTSAATTTEEAEPLTFTLKTEEKFPFTFTEQSVIDINATTSEVTLNMTTPRFSTVDEGESQTSTLESKIKTTSMAEKTTELKSDDMDTSLGVTSKTSASVITSTDTTGLITGTLVSEEETAGILTTKAALEDVTPRKPFETTTSQISTVDEAKSLTSTLIPEIKTESILTEADVTSPEILEAATSKSTLTEEKILITTLKPEKETTKTLTAETVEIKELSSETTTLRPSTAEEIEIVATTLKEDQKSTSVLTEKTEELASKTKDFTESTSRASTIEELELLTSTVKHLRETISIIPEISSESVSKVYDTTVRLPTETTKSRMTTVEEIELPSTVKSEIQTPTTLSDKTTEPTLKITSETSEEKIISIEEAEPQTSTMEPELKKTSLATEIAEKSVPESYETQTVSLESTSQAFSEDEKEFLITTKESTGIAEETSESVSKVEDISSGIEVSEFTTKEEKLRTSTLAPERKTTSTFTEETSESVSKVEDVSSGIEVSEFTTKEEKLRTSTLAPERKTTSTFTEETSESVSKVEDVSSGIEVSEFTTKEEELSTSTLAPERKTTSTFTEETSESVSKVEDVSSGIEVSEFTTKEEKLRTSTLAPERKTTSTFTEETSESVSKVEDVSSGIEVSEFTTKEEKLRTSTLAPERKTTSTFTEESRGTGLKEEGDISGTTSKITISKDSELPTSTLIPDGSSESTPEVEEIAISKFTTIKEELEKSTLESETESILTEETREAEEELKETKTTSQIGLITTKSVATETAELVTSTIMPVKEITSILTDEAEETASEALSTSYSPTELVSEKHETDSHTKFAEESKSTVALETSDETTSTFKEATIKTTDFSETSISTTSPDLKTTKFSQPEIVTTVTEERLDESTLSSKSEMSFSTETFTQRTDKEASEKTTKIDKLTTPETIFSETETALKDKTLMNVTTETETPSIMFINATSTSPETTTKFSDEVTKETISISIENVTKGVDTEVGTSKTTVKVLLDETSESVEVITKPTTFFESTDVAVSSSTISKEHQETLKTSLEPEKTTLTSEMEESTGISKFTEVTMDVKETTETFEKSPDTFSVDHISTDTSLFTVASVKDAFTTKLGGLIPTTIKMPVDNETQATKSDAPVSVTINLTEIALAPTKPTTIETIHFTVETSSTLSPELKTTEQEQKEVDTPEPTKVPSPIEKDFTSTEQKEKLFTTKRIEVSEETETKKPFVAQTTQIFTSTEKPFTSTLVSAKTISPGDILTTESQVSIFESETTLSEHTVITEETVSSNVTFAVDSLIRPRITVTEPSEKPTETRTTKFTSPDDSIYKMTSTVIPSTTKYPQENVSDAEFIKDITSDVVTIHIMPEISSETTTSKTSIGALTTTKDMVTKQPFEEETATTSPETMSETGKFSTELFTETTDQSRSPVTTHKESKTTEEVSTAEISTLLDTSVTKFPSFKITTIQEEERSDASVSKELVELTLSTEADVVSTDTSSKEDSETKAYTTDITAKTTQKQEFAETESTKERTEFVSTSIYPKTTYQEAEEIMTTFSPVEKLSTPVVTSTEVYTEEKITVSEGTESKETLQTVSETKLSTLEEKMPTSTSLSDSSESIHDIRDEKDSTERTDLPASPTETDVTSTMPEKELKLSTVKEPFEDVSPTTKPSTAFISTSESETEVADLHTTLSGVTLKSQTTIKSEETPLTTESFIKASVTESLVLEADTTKAREITGAILEEKQTTKISEITTESPDLVHKLTHEITTEVTIPSSTLSKEITEVPVKSTDSEQSTFSDVPLAVTQLAETVSDTSEKEQAVETKPVTLTTIEIQKLETSEPSKATEKTVDVTESTASTATTIFTDISVEAMTTVVPPSVTDSKQRDLTTMSEAVPTEKVPEEDLPEQGGCIVEGVSYKDGESIKVVQPCEKCHCSLGEITCFKIICKSPKEGCIPSANMTSECCPSSYDCPEDEELKTSTATASIHDITEKDLTTPIPISFMFSTMPTSIASTVLVTKFDKASEPSTETPETKSSVDIQTPEDKIISAVTTVALSTKEITEEIMSTETPLTTEWKITEEVSKETKPVSLEAETTEITPEHVTLITKQPEIISTTQIPVTLSKDIFKTETSETTLTPEKEIIVTKELMTGVEENITGVTKQPTETPTTFDTIKTTSVVSHEEKDISERTTLTSEPGDLSKFETTISLSTVTSEPEDATIKSTSIITDVERVTMEKATTGEKAIETVPTTERIDETPTSETKETLAVITTEKPLEEKDLESTTLHDFAAASVTDEFRTETPAVKEEITLSTSTLIPSKLHSTTESDSRKTTDNITVEHETIEALSSESTIATFGIKDTATDVYSTSIAEVETEKQNTTAVPDTAETHTVTLSSEEISTSEAERKVTDFPAATESKATELIDHKETTVTTSKDEDVTTDDIRKLTDFIKTTESRIVDTVEDRKTTTTLSTEELLISEGQTETTDLPRSSISKITETGITTDILSGKETSTDTSKINVTEDLSGTTTALHNMTTERTTLDMITDLQDKSTVPPIKVIVTTISETTDQATPSRVTSTDHTTSDHVIAEDSEEFPGKGDTLVTAADKTIVTTSSTKTDDYEIITEVEELNRSVTSLGRGVSVTTHIQETEFSTVATVGVANETTTLKEKSEEVQTTSSVTDKIFTFVSTRFTDIMKEITEFTTGKPEKESEATFENETISFSTPDMTTEKDEQVSTPLVHLTRRIDLELDTTTAKKSTSQEAETTRSQFTDELSTIEPHTDFVDGEVTSANDTGFSTSRRDMKPVDIFTTISSIITSMKQETISPVSESEKPVMISTEPVKVADSETSTYLIKDDSTKSISDYAVSTETTALESKPTFATHDSKTSLGVDETTKTVSPASYSEKDVLSAETTSKEEATETYVTEEESSKPTSEYASTEDAETLESKSTLATHGVETTLGAVVTTSSQINKTDLPSKVPEEISVTSLPLTTLEARTLETKETDIIPKSRPETTTAEDTLVSEFKNETISEVSLSASTTVILEAETAKSAATTVKISEETFEGKTESVTTASELKRDTTVSEMEMLSRGTRKDMELEVTLSPFTTDLTRERTDEGKISTPEAHFSFETTSPKTITSTTLLHKVTAPEAETTAIRDLKLSSLSPHTETHTEETVLMDNETKPTVSEKERAENLSTTPSVITDASRVTAPEISSTEKATKEIDVDITTQFAVNETTTASASPDITDLTKLLVSDVTSTVQDAETTASGEIMKTKKTETVSSSPEESTLPSNLTSVTDRTATTVTPVKTDKPKPEQEVVTIDLEAETVTSSPRDETSSFSEKADRTSPEVTTQPTKEEIVTEMLTKGYKGIETTTMQDEDDYLLDANTCIFEGRIYQSAEQIPRADPCEFCFCFRGDIICLQQSCPPPAPNCNQTMIPGYCCPRYECPVYLTSKNIPALNRRKGVSPIIIQKRIDKREIRTVEIQGCQINGTFYELGKTVTSASGPCLHCVCQADGLMHCDPQRCKPEAPLMLKMNNNYFRRR